MLKLCEHQRALIDNILSILYESAVSYPSIILIGPQGSGKRTIASETSKMLGMDYFEIYVGDFYESVYENLFGKYSEAKRAMSEGKPPGAFGVDSPTLIYLPI